jgi:HSP20 family molecular chaperone IbpA
MKGNQSFTDFGTVFDKIFEAANHFAQFDPEEFARNFTSPHPPFEGKGGFNAKWGFDENVDYYPNYSYPPMNVYMMANRSMVFEFALAGFDEKDISLSFQGDYMVFSAKLPERKGPPEETVREECGGNSDGVENENIHYFKRRLKMKDIEKQKYYVPLDKYAQEQVKAVFKNGILKITVPPKEEPNQDDGIKIEIIKDEN